MSTKLDAFDRKISRAGDDLFKDCEAVFICASRYPTSDNAIGKIVFIRKGGGPAYRAMLATIANEVDFSDVEIEEITPGRTDDPPEPDDVD